MELKPAYSIMPTGLEWYNEITKEVERVSVVDKLRTTVPRDTRSRPTFGRIDTKGGPIKVGKINATKYTTFLGRTTTKTIQLKAVYYLGWLIAVVTLPNKQQFVCPLVEEVLNELRLKNVNRTEGKMKERWMSCENGTIIFHLIWSAKGKQDIFLHLQKITDNVTDALKLVPQKAEIHITQENLFNLLNEVTLNESKKKQHIIENKLPFALNKNKST